MGEFTEVMDAIAYWLGYSMILAGTIVGIIALAGAVSDYCFRRMNATTEFWLFVKARRSSADELSRD